MGALDGPQRGSIVNISSIHAAVGFPGFAAYAMAKGGIEALTRQVAAEYVASGIRCNAVAPGLIESEMNAQLLAEASDPDALQAAWSALTPMGRWGTPDDVAAVVAFLLDGASGYITGEVLAVNGGATVLARGR
ncbi:MAG: SDR family oxidoreductase, partial [Microbacterium sp.]|nr:SDR family oxidoreductase [Microbacterium sp.]